MAKNPFGNFSFGTSTFTWPSADYFRQVGITDPNVLALAGKTISSPAGNTTSDVVASIYLQLGKANATKFFAPAGIDPQKIIAGDTTSSKHAKDYFTLVQSGGGFDKLKPSDLTTLVSNYTGGPKTPVAVQTPAGTAYTTSSPQATAEANAYNNVEYQLQNLGLGSLSSMVNDLVFKKGLTNGKAIWDAVRSTPEYKDMFQGLAEHNAKFPQKLTEAQYLQTAQQFVNTAQTYGLPQGVMTNKEIGQLIAGGVSPAEFNRRVQNGYLAAVNADPNTKAALAAAGVTMGDLTHYYLDPKNGEQNILQKTMAAQMTGYAQDVGVKGLTSDMAQQLATQAKSQLNPDGTYSLASAQKALDFAAQQQPLTGATPDRAPSVDTKTLIGSQIAGFGGTTQTEAQQQVTRAQQEAMAPMQKGGGFEESAKGVTGIGAAKD